MGISNEHWNTNKKQNKTYFKSFSEKQRFINPCNVAYVIPAEIRVLREGNRQTWYIFRHFFKGSQL